MRGIVHGRGKELIAGSVHYFDGDSVEAKLIRPIVPNLDHWWVEFDGDMDAGGRQNRRIRFLEKVTSND